MSSDDESKTVEGINLVPNPSRDVLNPRQLVDYREHRRDLVTWMLNLGKDPEHAEGYAHSTVRRRAHSIDIWFRWVWNDEGGYTTDVLHRHADAYTKHLAQREVSMDCKAQHQKSLKSYWKWKGREWDPKTKFSQNRNPGQLRDYLSREERRKIREAALEYGSVPSYNHLSPDERREWKCHIAQWYQKPMNSVTKADFDRANGFKIPSLVWVSLDAALRPIEVERSKLHWVDLENGVLRIPAKEASKGSDQHWVVSLQRRTSKMLERWLEERELYEKYDDSDAIWLNRKSNPYNSRSLTYLLRRLCDVAGIDYSDRQMSWYAVRHSTGTYRSREDGLKAAASQLRHTSIQTTARYDTAPPDERRAALERIEKTAVRRTGLASRSLPLSLTAVSFDTDRYNYPRSRLGASVD